MCFILPRILMDTSIPIPCMVLQPLPGLGLPQSLLHSSLFSALLLDPLTPNSCNASLWTTSAHLVLGLPTGLVLWKVPFKTFLGSSLPPFLLYGPPTLVFWFLYLPRCLDRYIGCTVHYSIWDASIGPYILRSIFLSNVFSICSVVCVRVQVTLP